MSKQPSELQPLLDDPTTPGPLADALRAAAEDGPSPAEIARLTASLGAALPPGALVAKAAAKTFGAKAVAAMVGAGIAAGVVAGVVGSRLVGKTDPEIQSGETTAAPPSASVSALSSSSSGPLAPPASAPLPEPTRPPPVATVTAPLPANPPAPSETALLDRGHQALRSQNPAAALAAADEHARAYPRGTFAQEREVIAIEALVALGRRPEAAKRAGRFRAAFPGSAHQARIDSLVGGP
jgi:hypothetical protein